MDDGHYESRPQSGEMSGAKRGTLETPANVDRLVKSVLDNKMKTAQTEEEERKSPTKSSKFKDNKTIKNRSLQQRSTNVANRNLRPLNERRTSTKQRTYHVMHAAITPSEEGSPTMVRTRPKDKWSLVLDEPSGTNATPHEVDRTAQMLETGLRFPQIQNPNESGSFDMRGHQKGSMFLPKKYPITSADSYTPGVIGFAKKSTLPNTALRSPVNADLGHSSVRIAKH